MHTSKGVDIIDTYSITATVTKIDSTNRKVTLQSEDGGEKTYTAPPSTDLGRIAVGDSVSVVVTEELMVALSHKDASPSVAQTDAVALAGEGHSGAVLVAEAVEMTAQITRLDTESRKVTFKLADGTSKTFKVGKHVDLSHARVGQDVVIAVAEALAIEVDKQP